MLRRRISLRPEFVLILILIGGLVVSGRRSDQGAEIRIGVIAYLTGSFADASGIPTQYAAQLAVREVNKAGGLDVGGRRLRVKLIIEDVEEGHPERVVVAAHKLINQENVVAIVGPQYSRDAIPVAQVAEGARIPMISPMSTHPETTAGKQYVFRVGFIDSFQGRVMARFVLEDLGLQKAAVLYDVASDYNRGIAEIFKQVFEEAGGQVVAFEAYTTGEKDFRQYLLRIRESGAKVLFLPNYVDDFPVQAYLARQMGIDVPVIGSDSWDGLDLTGHPELEGAFYSSHWHIDNDNERSRSFVEAYRQAYPDRTAIRSTAAMTYDAFGLLFQAIQSQGQADPGSIMRGLAAIEGYQGVSGVITYQEGGDPVKSAVIVQIKEGERVLYKRVTPE